MNNCSRVSKSQGLRVSGSQGLKVTGSLGLRVSKSSLAPVLVALLLGLTLAFAGETGRIVGKVVDGSTGEPVPGAVVEVEGSDLGNNTDVDGRYAIMSIPAGTWTITASATGYGSSSKKDVLVIADGSATVDFRISSQVIQVKGVTVTAEQPMVVRSEVVTKRSMTEKDFTRLPVAGLSALVGLQAGVTQNTRSGWTHLRGGRYNDVSYLIDGVSAKDAVVGTLWSSPRPTQENIEAVEVITGSFDAEYGEAMSGVIQTVTKEGGERTSSKLRYTTDEMFPGRDLNFGYNLAQFTLGGPLFIKPLRYFASAEYFRTNDASDALYQVHAPRGEYTIEGKANYNLPKGTFVKGDNLKVIVDGHHSDYQWQGYSNSWKYHLSGLFANRVRSNKANLRLNYLPAASTFIELSTGVFETALLRSPQDPQAEAEDTLGISGWARKAGLWDDYKFKSESWVFDNPADTYVDANGKVVHQHMPPDVAITHLYEAYRLRNGGTDTAYDNWRTGYALYNNPYGVPGTFVTEGDAYFHNRSTYDQYVKGSVTLTPGKTHEIKAGFELKQYNISEYTNTLPWDPNPFFERYHNDPFTGSGYVQDKADFEDLVVHAGLRFDYLDARTDVRVFPDSIGSRKVIADSVVRVGAKYSIAPRLGLSYPITDRIKFRFSYGHFYRDPDFEELYSAQLPASELTRRGNIVVGNPDLGPEKTIGYEMGFDDQISDIFEFDFTAFYKDVYGLTGVRTVPAVPMGYSEYYNVEYARIQGFEATMAKALDKYWSAKLSYTLSLAKGTASTSFTQYGSDHPVETDYFLDQDQRHSLSFDIGLSLPTDFSVGILREFDVSLLGHYMTGLPYSPTNTRGEPTGEQNSARMPDEFEMDSRIAKTFRIGKVGLNITCDILNILNGEIVHSVYAATGLPDYDGTLITLGQFSKTAYQLGDPAYQPARDANHDGLVTQQEKYDSYVAAHYDLTNSPLQFGPSRKIRFGVSLSF